MTTSSLPRPMKFQSLQDFVYGSSSDLSADLRKNSPPAPFTYKPKQSLFDRYNRNNLTLDQCNKKHLQIVCKPIILSEQNLQLTNQLMAKTFNRTAFSNNNQFPSKQLTDQKFKTGLLFPVNYNNHNYEQSNTPNRLQCKSPQKVSAKTSQRFYSHPEQQSQQFKQNQLLFNFKKIAQQKRQKKKAFLQDIQAKIALIQNEARQIEDVQFQEKCQISQLENMHKKINQQIIHNSFVGQVKHQAILNCQQEQALQRQKPLSINLMMEPNQINHVLQGHYEENERLLQQITKIQTKSNGFGTSQYGQSPNKSKQKQFYKSDRSNSFSKTMKKVSQKSIPFQASSNQKKLISTVTMTLPPKNKSSRK